MQVTKATATKVTIEINASDVCTFITALATGAKAMGDRAREISKDAVHCNADTKQRALNLAAVLGTDELRLRAFVEELALRTKS